MISIKDYAQSKGVTYEAVRKQVKRYKDELGTHVQKQGRTQYLDEEAVKILDSKRAESPVVLIQAGKDEEIERLTAENKALLLKLAEVQDALIQEQKKVFTLQEEKIELLAMQQERQEVSEADKKPWWKFW